MQETDMGPAECTPEQALYLLYDKYRKPKFAPMHLVIEHAPTAAKHFEDLNMNDPTIREAINQAYHAIMCWLAQHVLAEAQFVWYKTAHLVARGDITFAGVMLGIEDTVDPDLKAMVIRWRDCLQEAMNGLTEMMRDRVHHDRGLIGMLARKESSDFTNRDAFIVACLKALGVDLHVIWGLDFLEAEKRWYDRLHEAEVLALGHSLSRAKFFYKPFFERYLAVAKRLGADNA